MATEPYVSALGDSQIELIGAADTPTNDVLVVEEVVVVEVVVVVVVVVVVDGHRALRLGPWRQRDRAHRLSRHAD